MNIYWFSFSYKGRNKGVCIVQADCENSALDKMDNLGINPLHDDIACFQMEDLAEEANMEFNRLYSTEEMQQFGYKSIIEFK